MAALVWTLIHSLWQAPLFAIIGGLIILTTKRIKPVKRYNALCVLLFLSLATFVLTFWYEWHILMQTKPYPVVGLPDHFSGITTAGLLFKDLMTKVSAYIYTHTHMIVAVWLIFSIIKTVRMAFTLGYTGYIRKYRSVAAPVFWADKLNSLRTQLFIREPVLLLESAFLKIPVVYGYFKPVIFIPLGLLNQLPPAQIEAILLHELAHIRRNDYAINLLQQMAEIVFFFNPALLWLSAHVREEREYCCDELAIAQTGNRKDYIKALISFKELSLGNLLPGAIAFSGVKSGSVQRVSRIVGKHNHTLNLIEKISLYSCIVATFLFFSFCKMPQEMILPIFSSPVKQTHVDFPLGKVISGISDDLIKEGIIQNKEGLCFALTNTGLMISGIRQPDDVWEKLHIKYLRSSPYPIKPEYRDQAGFGIFYNATKHVSGIGTEPPAWNNFKSIKS